MVTNERWSQRVTTRESVGRLDSQIDEVVGVGEWRNDFAGRTSADRLSRQPFVDVLDMGGDHNSHNGSKSKGIKR